MLVLFPESSGDFSKKLVLGRTCKVALDAVPRSPLVLSISLSKNISHYIMQVLTSALQFTAAN